MIISGTSCYENAKCGNLVSITGDGGNAWGFYGKSYKKMAPRLYLWQYYDLNFDDLTEDELIAWYIKEFYNLRLRNLNPYVFLEELKNRFGENIILLCHESPSLVLNKEHFCHRRLIADWIELETGIVIPEISINDEGNVSYNEVYNLKPLIYKLIKK